MSSAAQRFLASFVGVPFGADAVNSQIAPVQAEVVRSLGLGHLDVAAAT